MTVSRTLKTDPASGAAPTRDAGRIVRHGMCLALTCQVLACLLLVPDRAGAQQAETATPAQTGGSGASVKSLDGKTIDIEEARRLFEEHQRELERVEKERQGLQTESDALSGESAKLQDKLITAAKQVQGAEAKLTRSEGEIEELKKQEAKIRIALDENRVKIAQMLAVMQRMGREPPPVIMTERNDALRMVRSAMVLASFFPGFKEKADQLSVTLNDLNAIIKKSQDEQTRFAAAQTDFNRLKGEIDTLLKQKRDKLQQNVARLEKLKAAAAKHSKAVNDLGELLQRLDTEVGDKSSLAAYEAELKQLGPAIELKPSVKAAAFVSPGRLKPAIPFQKAKGTLPFPAQGQRLKSFGVKDDAGGKSEGIYVETRRGAQITSPSDGWVIYAGQFRTYGQLLIINAGGGYHILLAGLDQIYTSVGQFVLAGEPVASMGQEPGQSVGSEQSRNPVLYIEFRKDARPVDPDPWWSEGVKEG